MILTDEQKEIMRIKTWFRQNDWKPNKIIRGEWNTNDTRWLEYLSECAIKRARLDELEEMLRGINNENQ